MTLEEMRERAQQLQARREELLALDQETEEGLSPEDLEELQLVNSGLEKITARIAIHTNDPATSAPAPKARTTTKSGRIEVKGPRAARDTKGGFNTFGEFALTVMGAATPGQRRDERLVAQQGNETGVGADGGFLVPPDFRETLMQKIMGPESLLGRTDGMQTASNSITVPTDETPPWNSDETAGIVAHWTGEGSTLTKSKAQFGQTIVPLHKLTALIPVTEEMTSDGPIIESYLNRKTPEVFDTKINSALLTGDGVGKPTGIVGHGFTVEQTTSTAAAAIVEYTDITNMWSRVPAQWRSNAVWLINPAVEPALNQMAFPGTGTAVPAYLPANGLSASPYATLMGRPVVPMQECAAPSSPGDIILADFNQYLSATKAGQGAIRTDVSMHIYFDTDELAFRFIIRVGGVPWYSTPITAMNGTYTQSGFVTLAARV